MKTKFTEDTLLKEVIKRRTRLVDLMTPSLEQIALCHMKKELARQHDFTMDDKIMKLEIDICNKIMRGEIVENIKS